MYEYGQLIARQRDNDFRQLPGDAAGRYRATGGHRQLEQAHLPARRLHQELQPLVEKWPGMTPAQALAAATGRPGAWLSRWSGIAGLGSVSVGAPADLLLIDGDPLQDIRASRNISLALTAGRKVTALPPANTDDRQHRGVIRKRWPACALDYA